jgi:lysophospholipase L1-like esterase
MLKQRYPQQSITVENEGRGGERIVEGITRFDQAIDAHRPAVLLLMDGANDIAGGQSAIAPAISGLDTMIGHANARGVQTFLATLPPEIPGRQRSSGAPFVAPFNDQVRTLAAQRRGVVLVDVFAAFDQSHLDTLVGPDGLHLTEAGYAAVARAFYDRIVATFEVVTTTATR